MELKIFLPPAFLIRSFMKDVSPTLIYGDFHISQYTAGADFVPVRDFTSARTDIICPVTAAASFVRPVIFPMSVISVITPLTDEASEMYILMPYFLSVGTR